MHLKLNSGHLRWSLCFWWIFHIFLIVIVDANNHNNNMLHKSSVNFLAVPHHIMEPMGQNRVNLLASISTDCHRTVSKCHYFNTSICLDVMLPYKHVSLPVSFVNGNNVNHDDSTEYAFSMIQEYLERWKGLRAIPQCWKALQTTLCASFFPRCDNESSRVSLPTYDMCRLLRHPCRVIDQYFKWPEFLRCENQTLFPTKCPNQYTDLKFSASISTVRCESPLVATEDRRIWYPGFDGCSLHCNNPLYTDEQHQQVSQMIFYSCMIGLSLTGWVVLTFMIDRKPLGLRLYTKIVFIINCCMLAATFGWTIQFVKGRNEVVCRPDNTTRYSEPSKPDNFYCCLSFFLIYYFSLAAVIWFVHLFQAFYDSFQSISAGVKADCKNKKLNFYMTAWSIPLIMSIFILLLGEIDGDGLRGVCFVGLKKPFIRIFFVFIPFSLCIVLAVFHSFRTAFFLFKLRKKNFTNHILHILIRLLASALCNLILFLLAIGAHFYEATVEESNMITLNEFIICKLNISMALPPITANNLNQQQQQWSNFTSTTPELDGNNNGEVSACRMYEPPSLMVVYIQLVSVFAANILASSWIWTKATLHTWRRFIVRSFSTKEATLRLKPYELIMNSYSRREQIQNGFCSPSFISNHADPVDMDLHSQMSLSISSNWQRNFHALLNRRMGLCESDIYFYDRVNNRSSYLMSSQQNSQQLSHLNASGYHHSASSVSEQSHQQSQYEPKHSELANVIRNQRRKSKKERERQLRQIQQQRLANRRDSDTSGNWMPSAAYPPLRLNNGVNQDLYNSNDKPDAVTKATSTGDLMNMLYNCAAAARGPMPNILQPNSQIAACGGGGNGFAPNPFGLALAPFVGAPFGTGFPLAPQMHPIQTTPTIVGTSHSGVNQLPISPSATVPARLRMTEDQRNVSFTFTHGMSDQCGQVTSHHQQKSSLVNPLLEQRRPDSNALTSRASTAVAATTITTNQKANLTNNFVVGQMSSMIVAGVANPAALPPTMNPYQMPPYQPYDIRHLMQFMHHQQQQPTPPNVRYYDTQAAFLAYQHQQQQTKSMMEFECLMREHEQYKSLITAHPSRSESTSSKYLPIHLTESEPSDIFQMDDNYSDDQSLNQVKRLVQERIQKVEDEINGNGGAGDDVDDNDDDDDDDDEEFPNDLTAMRKTSKTKKKSSKKKNLDRNNKKTTDLNENGPTEEGINMRSNNKNNQENGQKPKKRNKKSWLLSSKKSN